MGTVEISLKCPVCQDLFTDPATLPCGHSFCLTCIRLVWNADVSENGPFFCPECQILLPSSPTLEVNTKLQTKVNAFSVHQPLAPAQQTTVTALSGTSSTPSVTTIHCDHCIEAPSVAVRTCLTCDASLCQAHASLHQQRAALREHTVVEVTVDPMSLKCREHREELKLFCMEDMVPVCCLCALAGLHKNHPAVQLHEACSHFKNILETSMNQLLKRKSEIQHAIEDLESMYTQTVTSAADSREKVSDKYGRIRAVLDGDERLMLQVIDTEEAFMTEWLEAQRSLMEANINEADNLRDSCKTLLKETNELRFLQQATAQDLCKPLDLAPIQDVDKDLCDPERLRTVERLVDDVSVALAQHIPRMWSYLSSPTLDTKTAHPILEVSEDGKQVFWRREPLDEVSCYDSQYSVLAEECLPPGQHYWEVIVQDKPYWMIGVTTGSVSAKEGPAQTNPDLDMKKTYWCIYHGDGQYLACHDTQEEQITFQGKRIRKLGVLSDLQKGELSFYDADTLNLLHSFPVQCAQTLYPVFNPCNDVNGLNRQPLTLLCLRN